MNIPYKCKSGVIGSVHPLREPYASFEEFEAYANTYSLVERLGFESAQEAWDDNPWVESSTNPADFRIAEFPDAYLLVRESRSGQQWLEPIGPRGTIDLRKQLAKWVKKEFAGEMFISGELTPKLEGDYYGSIITDNRPPDSVVVWEGAGFYLSNDRYSHLRERA